MHKLTIITLYLLGLIQGVGFTTIPAAGNFLTSQAGFNLSSSSYGLLFVPMIIGAIAASFLAGSFSKRMGSKPILMKASLFNIVSMLLFAISNLLIHSPEAAYPLLMITLFLIGAGFGANLTILNTYVFYFFPTKSSTALTALHSCLGIGAALGPLSFNLFLKEHTWWLDPFSIALCYLILALLSMALFPDPHKLSPPEIIEKSPSISKQRVILFMAIALFYGICETTFGNWGTIFLHSNKGESTIAANHALSAFWGALTLGRILIVFLSLYVSPHKIYRCLAPILLIGLASLLFATSTTSNLLAFTIAGCGCSGFLPLTISLAGKEFFSQAALLSGELVALYMVGYGIASEGIGLFHQISQINFVTLYTWLLVPICFLIILSQLVARRTPSEKF